ncbi:hypothetical protein DFH07DRAFT_779736 [Mycena maculata]|uniref:Uncharacterized protein n=1 Tax=Mycena maculata TaxID=230809 RepID=A0AAD7MXB6_9AGAR|nr:hypothetical protein DFH07DRAFT_779736 [Mycena maculata]
MSADFPRTTLLHSARSDKSFCLLRICLRNLCRVNNASLSRMSAAAFAWAQQAEALEQRARNDWRLLVEGSSAHPYHWGRGVASYRRRSCGHPLRPGVTGKKCEYGMHASGRSTWYERRRELFRAKSTIAPYKTARRALGKQKMDEHTETVQKASEELLAALAALELDEEEEKELVLRTGSGVDPTRQWQRIRRRSTVATSYAWLNLLPSSPKSRHDPRITWSFKSSFAPAMNSLETTVVALTAAQDKALKQEALHKAGKLDTLLLKAWLNHYDAPSRGAVTPPPTTHERKRAELIARVVARKVRVHALLDLRRHTIKRSARAWPRPPCHPHHYENLLNKENMRREEILAGEEKKKKAQREEQVARKAHVEYLMRLRASRGRRKYL